MTLSDKHLAIFGGSVYRASRWLLRQALRLFRFRILQRVFLPDPLPTGAGRPVRQVVLALICLCVSGGLLYRMIHLGTSRGMDRGLYEVVQDAARAMAVAISDMHFHLNRGYVGYTAIFDELEKGGFTTNGGLIKNLGRTYPANLVDRALLDHTLQTALNTPVPKDVGFGDHSLLSMGYAELGLVDYFKLTFHLFGYRVEGAFYIYFLLLGISVAAFILAYWRSSATLAIPILFLAAGNLIFSTDYFDNINSQSVANPRFISTLGILAGLHILMLMLGARRATIFQVALACVQTLIFAFTMSVRATLLWFVMLIVLVAIVQIAVLIARSEAGRSVRASIGAWSAELAGLRLWPALIFLIGTWTYQFTISMNTHPSYELDDFLPSHLRYHNAFIGLKAHPQFYPLFGDKYYYHADSDTLGFLVADLFMMKYYDVPESYYLSPLYGGPKMRLDDRMAKKAYLQFIMQHPGFVIEAHIYKAGRIRDFISHLMGGALSRGNARLIMFCGIVIAGLFLIAGQTLTPANRMTAALRLAIVGTVAALFSFLPNLYSVFYPQVLSDGLWLTFFVLLLAGACGLAAVACIASMLLRKQAGAPASCDEPERAVATSGLTTQVSTTYVRLFGSIALSAALAWGAVTYFNHGKPRPNASPTPMPAIFGLKPPPPPQSPATSPH
jgi:hypothetical protein